MIAGSDGIVIFNPNSGHTKTLYKDQKISALFKDDKGNMVIPYKYSSAGFFEEDGLAAVSINYNSKFGFIDKSGNEVIPLIYSNAGYYAQGLAPVYQKEKWGFIDTKGNQVISFSYL